MPAFGKIRNEYAIVSTILLRDSGQVTVEEMVSQAAEFYSYDKIACHAACIIDV